MTGPVISLPWGSFEKLELELPSNWKVAGILEPAPRPALPDVQAALREALARPIGSKPLRELAKGAAKVCLLVDDLSRPTPSHLFIDQVLAELAAGDVKEGQITVLTTLGVHRPMTVEDLRKKLGPRAASLRWENHDCADPEKNLLLGTTSRGTRVLVSRLAAQADLVVSLGIIEPHVIASFGGGYKNLIPGAAGAETIGATHVLNLTPATFNMVGRPPDENPMRLDLEEGGRMLQAPFFVVNVVLNKDLKPVRLVAGDPVAAHREGAKTCAELYGVKIEKPADVLITCSYPMDSDLRQGLKALANGIRAVRPGGLLIDLVRAEEGMGVLGIAKGKSLLGRRALRLLAPLLLPLVKKINKKGQSEEDKFFTYFALNAVRRNRLLLYTPTLSPAMVGAIPFADFAFSKEELMRKAAAAFPGPAQVLVFPAGGVTYPIV